jgi:hypothetical protein
VDDQITRFRLSYRGFNAFRRYLSNVPRRPLRLNGIGRTRRKVGEAIEDLGEDIKR